MAYFLFVDESGHDHKASPYEVLAGLAVEDRDLWNLVLAVQDAEIHYFGTRYSIGKRELKGRKFLDRETYAQVSMAPPLDVEERRQAARRCLEDGRQAGGREIIALAQAKWAFVPHVIELCSRFHCRVFASIVDANAPPASPDYLRKDYAYLFERFYYYLEDDNAYASGIVVFDELEKSQSHILVGQMSEYFQFTMRGKQRAGQIIPEPFFVHSDLSTGIQLAELVAYITSWGVRLRGMDAPIRPELAELGEQVCRLRYRAVREVEGNPDFGISSFKVLADLRTREEKVADEKREAMLRLRAPKPPTTL